MVRTQKSIEGAREWLPANGSEDFFLKINILRDNLGDARVTVTKIMLRLT